MTNRNALDTFNPAGAPDGVITLGLGNCSDTTDTPEITSMHGERWSNRA